MSMYYLCSLESRRLSDPRECEFLRELRFKTGKECVLARLSPGINGEEFGIAGDIETVILAARYEGESPTSIKEYPFFVFVAISRVEHVEKNEEIEVNDVEIIAWGELYRSRSDAINHVFD